MQICQVNNSKVPQGTIGWSSPCFARGEAPSGPIQCSSVAGWVGTVLSLFLHHLNSRVISSFCTVSRKRIYTLCTVLSSLTQSLMCQPHRPYTAIFKQGNFSVEGLWATETWFFFSLSSFLFLFGFLFCELMLDLLPWVSFSKHTQLA